MNTIKSILVTAILSFVILGCETVKEAENVVAPPTIDTAIIGQWGQDPKQVKFLGSNMIYFEFRSDGTVIMNAKVNGDSVIQEGSKGKYEANEGKGTIYMPDNTSVSFTYTRYANILEIKTNKMVAGQGFYLVSQQSDTMSAAMDKAILGKWGMDPALVKASGSNTIAYDFHADGSVVKNIVIAGNVVQDKGMEPETFQANNGVGHLGDGTPGHPVQKFMYTINGDVLKLDSCSPPVTFSAFFPNLPE